MAQLSTEASTTTPPALPARAPAPAVQGFPRKLARYLALTLQQAGEDGILLTASALAFVTILSLIPLLAAFSFVGARVFNQYQQRSLEVFIQILPYSDETLVDQIGEFVSRAGTLHGFGLALFFLTTLMAFATVEEALNRIWNVSQGRPLRVRLVSFILLMFLGPLLLGATFSSLILLRQNPGLRLLFQESILFTVVPFVATVLGLTGLYWKVPYTAVQLRAALAGGLFAGILLEILRQGFGTYVEFFRNMNVVYGSFAIALLFMISVELTWAIVLLGSEAAYTAQHFALLARGLHRNPPLQASWVGLAALALIGQRWLRGDPSWRPDVLATRLGLPPRNLEVMLRPLVLHKLLRKAKRGEYLLAAPPHQIPVSEVFAAYDNRARRGADLLGGEL
ncbi:MAG TPA: YihY/virulence factor BrkB family protein, partial [Thermoanaerobaculia bacterium]|nr:YihY/virulence factor BrkB family protein [Thermoanaerobaculia bacterium]